MSSGETDLIAEVAKITKDAGFEVYIVEGPRKYCFNISAKRDDLLLFIKILTNIDCITETQANELKFVASLFNAKTLVVGEKNRRQKIEDDAIYIRYGIPTINVTTLAHILKNKMYPLIYAKRGGYYVRINGRLLRELRERMGLSLGELAEMVGVSRRAIYEYERDKMDATLDTAIKLEELFHIAILKPIEIFNWIFDFSEEQLHPSLTSFEKLVNAIFAKLGMKIMFTDHTPFDAISVLKKEFIITGLSDKLTKSIIENKIKIISKISSLTEREALIITSKTTPLGVYIDIPIISILELKKLRSAEEFAEKIDEKRSK